MAHSIYHNIRWLWFTHKYLHSFRYILARWTVLNPQIIPLSLLIALTYSQIQRNAFLLSCLKIPFSSMYYLVILMVVVLQASLNHEEVKWLLIHCPPWNFSILLLFIASAQYCHETRWHLAWDKHNKLFCNKLLNRGLQ